MDKCEWCNYRQEEWKLFETTSWVVYLADVQDYVGRCILVLKRHCGSLAELNLDEWLDLKFVIERLDNVYREALKADLCNWSCLMNDFYKQENPNPHLHIHVRPRYKNPLMINGRKYADTEFAHHYALKKEVCLLPDDRRTLYLQMKHSLSL